MTPANSGRDQAGRWAAGQSGNPAGKPKGCRHHATRAALSLLEGEAETLARKAVEMALAGDVTALRLCLERIAPAARSRAVQIDLPELRTPDDLLTAQSAIVAAMAQGEITPEDASAVAGVVELKRRAIETVEHERRIAALEAARNAAA